MTLSTFEVWDVATGEVGSRTYKAPSAKAAAVYYAEADHEDIFEDHQDGDTATVLVRGPTGEIERFEVELAIEISCTAKAVGGGK